MDLKEVNKRIGSKRIGSKIFVEWIDAYTDDGWKSFDDSIKIDESRLCFTNGFFLGVVDDTLIVCHTKGKTIKEDNMGRVYIPVPWVRKVK